MSMTGAERMVRHRLKRRGELLAALGRKCAECGTTDNLEFDHLYQRDWKSNQVWASTRLRIYAEEARRGEIQVLCRGCNARKGQPGEPVDNGSGF